MAGEIGEYWQASQQEYSNTLTKIKMKGKLSQQIYETLGVRQGQVKSSDHYKVYVGPALDTIDSADLGVWVGPVNSGVSACADDILGMSDDPNKLQGILNIASFYGKMYRVRYGTSKTKVTVTGSDIDMRYYQDIRPWVMDGETVKVEKNNDRWGQIISGQNQYQKNIDKRLNKARRCLFSLLGPCFAYKNKMSPAVKLHIF